MRGDLRKAQVDERGSGARMKQEERRGPAGRRVSNRLSALSVTDVTSQFFKAHDWLSYKTGSRT